MLKEIKSEQFIENPIKFSNGLNAVLGDDISTNSIGKSTLLMIIDFVFGGKSFITNDSGVIQKLGHQNFLFKFEFDHALGLALALASALLAAMFTVANSRLVQRIDAYIITFYEMIGATVFSLFFVMLFEWQGWSNGEPYIPVAKDWIWILFLALICTVYASTMATHLMKQFSAYLINLTINLEPVYGIALAFFFFGEKERMTTEFYMGTLLILLAVLLYPLLINTVLGKKGT